MLSSIPLWTRDLVGFTLASWNGMGISLLIFVFKFNFSSSCHLKLFLILIFKWVELGLRKYQQILLLEKIKIKFD